MCKVCARGKEMGWENSEDPSYIITTLPVKKGGGGNDLRVKENHIRSMKRKFDRGDKQRDRATGRTNGLI